MSKRFSRILTVSIIAVFVVGFALATVYDFEISRAIARLSDGNYISNSLFGKIMEVIGEAPMYIIGVFASSVLARLSLTASVKWKKICFTALSSVLGVFALTLMLLRMTEYVYEQSLNLESFEKIETILLLGYAVLSVGLFALALYLTSKIPEKHIKKLAVFSVAYICMIAMSQGFVQGIKSVVGRQRYRMISVLEHNDLNGLIDYTKWFVINGKRTVSEQLLALGIAKDGYKSFPSGHVCAWGLIFAISVLPDYLSLTEEKRIKLKVILFAVGFVSTLLMAYSRILVGAHYATDVLFAGAWTYFSVYICSLVARKIAKIK